MADDLKNKGPQDAARINTTEKWEIAYWTKALGCTYDELIAAVKAVGNSVEAVREFMKKK
jgi:hypothetical protein